jgi:hypothetical protein
VILISHRGNINSRNPRYENTIKYIDSTLKKKYNVEVDVYCFNDNFYLGHDKPEELVSTKFLETPALWIHCKNMEALEKLNRNKKINCFYQTNAEHVSITSKGYHWLNSKCNFSYPMSIVTFLYRKRNFRLKNNFAGICSDYVKEWR